MMIYLYGKYRIFKETALWADSFYKLKFVHPSVPLFNFELLFKRFFTPLPEIGCLKFVCGIFSKLHWVGPSDNRPSTNQLHHFVKTQGPTRHRPTAHPIVFRCISYFTTLTEHAVHRLRQCPAFCQAGTCLFSSVQLEVNDPLNGWPHDHGLTNVGPW